MKRTKKLFAILLALVMTMALSVSAFAAEGSLAGGTITIKNAVVGEEYTIYQIAYLESYNADTEAYAYKATSAWSKFLKESDYVDVDDSGYVTWHLDENETQANAADVQAFVAAALAYAEENNIESDGQKTAGGTTVTFGNENPEAEDTLMLGWYLVDSSLGSLCSLNTTNTAAEIEDKNTEPDIKKEVDGDGTISVIDTITYKLTVTVGKGVDDDYTITDTLPDGFLFNKDVVVSIEGWKIGENYTVNYSTDDDGNAIMTIVLDGDSLAALEEGTKVIITYTAKVDENITVDEKYTNDVTMEYKEHEYEASADVITYDIGEGFTKVDGSKEALAGVGFVLGRETEDGSFEYATFDDDGYLTDWVSRQDGATTLYTDENGNIAAYGLDAGTYTLIETAPLDGYNKLSYDITAVIAENGDVTYSGGGQNGDKITVVNESGSLLPSTGGMGTTVLYIAGIVLVLGAGITLVVRRRMSAK